MRYYLFQWSDERSYINPVRRHRSEGHTTFSQLPQPNTLDPSCEPILPHHELPSPAETPDPSATLVLHVDVLLLSVLGAFTLFALPRAIARFMRPFEWTRGFILYNSSKSHSSTARPPDDTASEKSNISVRPVAAGRSTSLGSGMPPPHVRSWSTAFPGLTWLLGTHIRPGYSVGRLILIYAYVGVILYAGLLHSNPFTNPVRAGLVTVSQVPLVVVLATKNNIVGALVGHGYERVSIQCFVQ